MVYVSSPSLTLASRQSALQIQSELTKAQTELASGVDADAGLSLGARSSQLVDLTQQQSLLQAMQTNNSMATTRLSTANTALTSISTAASTFLAALTTASSTGGMTTSLQTSAQTSLAALTSALNTSVSGQYIFAGINTAVQPVTNYVQSPASANKTAIDSSFSSAFGFSQNSASASSIDGTDMTNYLTGSFASMFSSSGFSTNWSSASNQVISSQISPSESVDTSVSANSAPFRQLAQAYAMVTELGGTNLSSSASQAVIAQASSLVAGAINGLTTVQAQVGITQNAITTANTNMQAQNDVITTQTSSLVGVDGTSLATRISNLSTQLQASYEVTNKLQSMSLVNYLT